MAAFLAVLSLVPLAVLARGTWAVWRFARLAPAAKRHYPAALWAKVRWRWLTRNLGLSYVDQHRKPASRLPVLPGATSVKIRAASSDSARLRFPRARIRPDAFGLVAAVKTVPKVGRAEFEKSAPYIADAWKCHRVQVSQPRPGRLVIRGLKTDPLTLPFGAEDAPPGVYGTTYGQEPDRENRLRLTVARRPGSPRAPREPGAGAQDPRPGYRGAGPAGGPLRLYLGRDEWAAHRWLTLNGLTGITVGGLPGYGKTSLVLSLLMQLAALPVQFCLIDLKGGGDFTDWADRAWIYTGDELPAAAAALEDVHSLMRNRLSIAGEGGPRNRWRTGPTDDWPLIVTVIDECHGAFDESAVKNDKQAEAHVRACRTLTGQLVRKGRSVLMLTVLITQKQTGDAIPTAIRDNCGFGVSFAVKTKDAAVASLGDHIREHPSYCPTTLQDPAYTGVCTAALRTGQDPFVRLRVPEVTEEAAAARAAETAVRRRDPSVMPAPAPAPEITAPAVSGPAPVQQASPVTTNR